MISRARRRDRPVKIEDLKKRKEELGYTNEMVSALSGVPLGTVQKFFGGATSRPRFNTLQSIECVLFPEKHSPKEAALYRDIVHNLTLDYADGVSEMAAFDEYSTAMPVDDQKKSYDRVPSWKEPGTYTVEDWRSLSEDTMMELIDGVLYNRNTPTAMHQYIVSELFFQLSSGIKSSGKKECLTVPAPVVVQLNKNDERNCLIPDVLIVCNKEKYKDGKMIIGAPDYVAEVLSPSTEKYDRIDKFSKYWEAGVREYWLIRAEEKEVWVYQLDKTAVITKYSFEDQIPLGISEGNIIIDFKSISDGLESLFG